MSTSEGDVWSKSFLWKGCLTEMLSCDYRALHRSPQDWSSYNGFLSNASTGSFTPSDLKTSTDSDGEQCNSAMRYMESSNKVCILARRINARH